MYQLIEVSILEFKTIQQIITFSLICSDLLVMALVTNIIQSVKAQRYNMDFPLAFSSLVKCACSCEISVIQYNFFNIF
jgi:hypothetical protein